MRICGFYRGIPDFRRKCFLHLASCGCLIANLIVFAIMFSDVRAWALGAAAVFALYMVVFLFDNRKHEWAWWAIIFMSCISVAISVCFTLLSEFYWYFAIISAQIVVSGVFFVLLKKKRQA